MAQSVGFGSPESEDADSNLAQKSFYCDVLFIYWSSSKVVTFNFQKTQYCVTVSISYSRVGSRGSFDLFSKILAFCFLFRPE